MEFIDFSVSPHPVSLKRARLILKFALVMERSSAFQSSNCIIVASEMFGQLSKKKNMLSNFTEFRELEFRYAFSTPPPFAPAPALPPR